MGYALHDGIGSSSIKTKLMITAACMLSCDHVVDQLVAWGVDTYFVLTGGVRAQVGIFVD